MYRWVQLRNGNKRTCGYIEERGAKVGNKVELVDLDGEMWDVMSVDPTPFSRTFVMGLNKKHKVFQESLKGGGIDE